MKPIKLGAKEIPIKPIALIALTVLLGVLAIFSCFAVAKRFCRVGRIEVDGENWYSEEQLMEGLGVNAGDRLFSLDTDALQKRMLEEYPFLLELEIRPVFPNRLVLRVTEWVTPWYIEISGGRYALNENLLVIDQVEQTEGMTKLILPDVQRVIAGSVPEFSKDAYELRKTLEIIDTVRSASYYHRMTEVNVVNRRDIQLVVDGKFTVKLGDMTELAHKLETVRLVLESKQLEGAESAEIIAENPELGVAVSPKFPPMVPTDTEEG